MRRLACACIVAFAVAVVSASARTGAATDRKGALRVAFLRGEQLARVSRPGKSPTDAVRALIAGPTAAERAHGFRTYFTRAMKLRRLSVSGSLATIDFNGAFVSGSAERRTARVAQLLRTLTGLHRIVRVQLLVDGAKPLGLVKGISLGRPITLRLLTTPNVAVPVSPPLRLPAPDPATKLLQQQLIKLGYLLRGDDDGRFGPATSDAILAFQKWERLPRTGMIDAATRARLASAKRPKPISHGLSGKRAEILLRRQVALLIRNNLVVRAISVSTGKPSTPTPPGNYRVYAKIQRWWSTPFREWLPWALPFVGGIAFHEFQVVPTYPASHGCVRQLPTVARWTYGFAYVGMPVKVTAAG
jgi:Putative peptidoglycan binding domain/Sporulation and spore germination/L,D-transpeptidase catalytic domain